MKKIFAALLVLVPSVALAEQPITDFNTLTQKLTGIGNTVIGLLIALAVIYIIWHTVQFIMKAGSDDAAAHRTSILWGIVGLAVILSIWGLVNILTNTFTTQNQAPVQNFPTNPNPPLVQ